MRWVMQGWGGVGWVLQGGVGHIGVGGSCRVGWVMQGLGGSYRGRVGHIGVGWVMQGWGGSYSDGMGWVGHEGMG